MVIPMDGPQTVLVGPPPVELESNFATLKKTTIMMVVGVLVQLVGAMAISAADGMVMVMGDNMVTVFLFFIAVWLLKDDPTFNKIYTCLGSSICTQCAETCPTSMGCLRNYYMLVGLNVVLYSFRFLLDVANENSGYGIVHQAQKRMAAQDPFIAEIAWVAYHVGKVTSILGELAGCIVAKQTYDKAMRMGLGVAQDNMGGMMGGGGDGFGGGFGGPGGGWGGGALGGGPMGRAGGGGGGRGGGNGFEMSGNRGGAGPTPFSGRSYGFGAANNNNSNNNNNNTDLESGPGGRGDDAPARESRPAAGFVTFAGQGHRLGA